MELNRLEYFFKAAQMGSFSAAASELFTTQSTLSKHIQKLEKELGVQLFDRTHRVVTLTQAGHTLYSLVPDFLLQYSKLLQEVCSAKQSLRIAALPVMEQYGITKYLSDFAQRNPLISLEVQELENAAIPETLKSGKCELAFFRIAHTESYPWKMCTLCQDELALVVPRNHRLAERDTVSLREFKTENFIFLGKGTRLYENSVEACRKAGFEPHIIYTGSSGESIARLINDGVGVAVFMKQVALGMHNSNMVVLNIEETVKSSIVLATLPKKTHSAPARLFWSDMCIQLKNKTN